MYDGIRNIKVETARKKMHSEVTSYKLSPEELAKYNEGDNRIKLTKEIYEKAKALNKSDIAILKEYRVNKFRLAEMKNEWYPKPKIEEEGVGEVVRRDDKAVKNGLTKEVFISKKEKGELDSNIAREFGLTGNHLPRLREAWGLQGKRTGSFMDEAKEREKTQSIDNAEPQQTNKIGISAAGKSNSKELKTSPITDVATVTLTDYRDLEEKLKKLEEKSLRADDLFFEHEELKEKNEKLQEDYDVLSEEAEKLTNDLKTNLEENQTIWARNKELQEENEALKKKLDRAPVASNGNMEKLYELTASALVAHIELNTLQGAGRND